MCVYNIYIYTDIIYVFVCVYIYMAPVAIHLHPRYDMTPQLVRAVAMFDLGRVIFNTPYQAP